MNSKILIIGQDGLGQEVTKNLCLMGVSNIWIYDREEVKEEDLGSGFFFKKKNIGSIRDESLIHRFRGLNEYVQVHIAPNLESFDNYDVVIVCNEQIDKQIEFNRQTRKSNCKFISCQTRGVFSQLFCDFGTDFICVDSNGEPLITGMINDITPDGILTVVKDQRHNLEDGDLIKILHKEEYEGLLFKVTTLSPECVQLKKIDGISVMDIENESTRPFKFPEVYGGDFEQVKKPRMLHFRPLEEALEAPQIVSSLGNEENEEMIHKCFIALSEYTKSFGSFPNGNTLLSYFIKKYQTLFDAEPLIREFGRQSDTILMPMCSIIGGFAAQEAIKAVSCKFNPIRQFFYFDALQVVPESVDESDTNSEGYGRYTPLVRIFGQEAVKRLFGLNIFVVGSGAIGCEHLKNLVMCGMGTEGKIHVTDMDSIEQSNLTRQFLFSKNDVSQMKAEVAVKEVKNLNEDFAKGFIKNGVKETNGGQSGGHEEVVDGNNNPYIDINSSSLNNVTSPSFDTKTSLSTETSFPNQKQPSLSNQSPSISDQPPSPKRQADSTTPFKKIKESNLVYYNLKVGDETEEVFSEVFFQDLDIVANALDNVEARVYVDNRCLISKKYLVDAGTSGTKGNVQTIVPFFSEPYGDSVDPPESSIPICTIKNFPFALEHTIEWAMSRFKYLFCDRVMLIKNYLEDPSTFDEENRFEEEDSKNVQKDGVIEKKPESIQEILKKVPRSLEGCIKGALMLFVKYFHSSIQDLLRSLPPDCKTKEGLPFWMPPKRPPTPINFDIKNPLHITFVQSVANIYSYNFGIDTFISKEKVIDYITNEILDTESLPLKSPVKEEDTPLDDSKFKTSVFEKDDDSNFHVDFVYSCANLRATNYKIKNQSRLFIKGIAGRIVPAIATTTGVVSGLATLEMIKMALGIKKYKNYFLNLALPFFAVTDPKEAKKKSYVIDDKEYYFTVWNKLEYKDTKLSNILKAFEIQFKRPLTMITIDNKLVYWNLDDRYNKNLEMKVSEIAPKINNRLYILLVAITDTDEDLPLIVVKYE
jgi:molybdopterin/thiamine biosynthesis adenylyltransferase